MLEIFPLQFCTVPQSPRRVRSTVGATLAVARKPLLSILAERMTKRLFDDTDLDCIAEPGEDGTEAMQSFMDYHFYWISE